MVWNALQRMGLLLKAWRLSGLAAVAVIVLLLGSAISASALVFITWPVTTATPSGGYYASAQSVTLAASAPATIYYTTDGADPATSPSRQTYATPISISATTTLKFYAVDAAGVAEPPQSAVYTIFDPANLTFTYGGTAPWFVQSAVNHDGVDAHQSGKISYYQSSWMETTVTGPGAIRFWWKVSSGACCDPLKFTIDGVQQAEIKGVIDWQSKAYAIPEGNHTLRWSYSTDSSILNWPNAGWVDQIVFTQGTSVDLTPPITTASPAAGIYSKSQSVTLTANEPATIYYTTDVSIPTTSSTIYTAPVEITKRTYLRYFAVDTSGNFESVHSEYYEVDVTPPNTTASGPSGPFSGVRDVWLFCSDTDTSCSATYYCLGSGCTPTTPYSSSIKISASTDLRFFSVDRVGNTESIKTVTYTVLPDTIPPITTPSIPGGTYNNPFQKVSLSCGDNENGSGCKTITYCLGTGCTPNIVYPGSLQIFATAGLGLISNPIAITDSTELRFYSEDKSGNKEAIKTVSYTIDITPPTTTATPPGGYYSTPQTVTLSCSDGSGSGCSSIYYCLGQGCLPATAYSAPLMISSSEYLSFYANDSANNSKQKRTEHYTLQAALPSTINVPGDHTTIQAAIDAAKNGDTVRVAPGTYIENINFKGKAIAVVSSEGPDVTIIDGNQKGSVVSFNGGEGRTSYLDGFTIRNGKASGADPFFDHGGGLYISYSSPTIRNNRISANSALREGGGVYVVYGAPLIRYNIITGNSASSGGGIYLSSASSAEIFDNSITQRCPVRNLHQPV